MSGWVVLLEQCSLFFLLAEQVESCYNFKGKLYETLVSELMIMNHEKLSLRLQRVALHIPKESILADIGSDHAYLPCYAVTNHLCARAIAGEVVEGPYQSALKQVKETGLQARIDVRKGDGLDVLEVDEATSVTIAGMGGTLITSILERGKHKLAKVVRLILQPNVGASNVRIWLIENDWELKDEEIIEEDGKIYEILIAEKGNPLKPYEGNRAQYIQFGPFLMKQHTSTFVKKWTHEKNHYAKIIEQMDASGNSSLADKRNELLEQIAIIEEVLVQ